MDISLPSIALPVMPPPLCHSHTKSPWLLHCMCCRNDPSVGFCGQWWHEVFLRIIFNGWYVVFTIARKEGRYREPPPTPPGYIGIPITDFPEGPSHPTRKPPDYNVALQRSRMVARPADAAAPAPTPQPHAHPAGGRPLSKPQWHKPNECDPRLAPYQSQGFSTEEDGT